MGKVPASIIVAEQAPLLPKGGPEAHSAEGSCCKILSTTIQRFAPSPTSPIAKKSYPSIADIPFTSAERLAQAAVTSNELTASQKIEDIANTTTAPVAPRTYLYLAYGSNLAAETFLGRRGIRPLSRINVSAPAFDLNFALPGLPYWEPCFANVEPRRKIPQPPPVHPPQPPVNPPKPPPIDPNPKPPVDPPPASSPGVLFPSLPPRDGPVWTKGLYGVVYEVTAEDYATIVKTEGGGSSYKDVVTPCIPLPPPMHIPETPLVPELPKPFLAHTLYAPRLPIPNPPEDDSPNNDNNKKKKAKKWLGRLLLPIQRPPDYAQPSLRYLTLIRDGARENYLPDDYQLYLAELHDYVITTRRQTLGKWLYALVCFPWLLLVMGGSRLFADKDTGRVPSWLGVAMTVLMNLMWMVYDGVFKKWFGDGERTEQKPDDDGGDDADEVNGTKVNQKWNLWSGYGRRDRRSSFVLPGQGLGAVCDEEKNRLLDDW
ncbi:uncharacterized protein B0I36DRAFT_327275 [Microdochium trichocladiopsis]|uniref:gamma-glutamylcyclotransferase n=1 Tax=Microdochium trichocladiopsis TaxID=1682393 RepID=A0A9P8Y1L2_9PEZI|nr:uncharacterized protein B0I36DRAFT_327275 [Microdochium trichocladiopsis]KAH7027527.1 hypothetical protein B0I36DRAFT_327275 [Microdochium trichocladiopsis]